MVENSEYTHLQIKSLCCLQCNNSVRILSNFYCSLTFSALFLTRELSDRVLEDYLGFDHTKVEAFKEGISSRFPVSLLSFED